MCERERVCEREREVRDVQERREKRKRNTLNIAIGNTFFTTLPIILKCLL